METLKRVLLKASSKPMQRIYTRVPAPAGAFPHKFNAFSFHYTTDYAVLFSLLNCKRILQVEFLNDTLVHIQVEVLNIGTFKMFKTKFKPEVLKATAFKR